MSKQKLLLADDSVTIQKVVNLTFADEGFDVIAVGDGNSAMDKIREDMPDIILADVNMPGLNGYEICEKIRQFDGEKRTPVVLLVGSFEPFDENEAKRVGADDFLTKPFQSINQLVNTVSVLLSSNDAVEKVEEDETSASEFAAGAAAGGTDQTENGSSPISEFEDAGIDDEMIQTDQVGGMAVGDLMKFETHVEPDSTYETTQEFEMTGDIETTSYDAGGDFEIVETDESSEFGSYEGIEGGDHGEGSAVDQEADFSKGYEYVSGEDSESGAEFENTISDHQVSSASEGEELELDETNLLEVPFSEFSENESDALFDDGSDTSMATEETHEFDETYETGMESDVEAKQEFGEIDSSQSYETEGETSSTEGSDFVTIEPEGFGVNTQTEGNDWEESNQETHDSEPQFATIATATDSGYENEYEESEAAPAAQDTDPISPELVDEIASKVEARLDAKFASALAAQEPEPISPEVIEDIASKVEEKLDAKAQENVPAEQTAADLVTPELIDEITRRVMENLSDKVIKEIAWEIVPQQSERIIREIANEKMNE